MNKLILIISIILGIHLQLASQNSKTVFYIKFPSNEYNLTEEGKSRIDSVLNINLGLIEKVELVGHTDNRGSNEYNLKLSEQRVLEVKNYLLNKGVEDGTVFTNYVGENTPKESNIYESGRQQNRRVELSIEYKRVAKEVENKITINKDSIQEHDVIGKENLISNKLSSFGDTTMIIEEVQIVMSKWDLDKYKDCLKFNPISSGQEALNSNITTMTVRDELLISCGIIEITLEKPCEGCFDKPVKVRFPVKAKEKCNRCRFGKVYNINRNGKWIENEEGKVKKVNIDGKYYYEIILKCPTTMNCDCKPTFKEIKIKYPRKYTVLSSNVVYDCPVANYVFTTKKNKAKGKLSCTVTDKEAYLYSTLLLDGDTIRLSNIPLTELNHSIWRRCKSHRKRNKLGVFRAWEYKIYAKYKIREEDIHNWIN